jgi:hypothetical protein
MNTVPEPLEFLAERIRAAHARTEQVVWSGLKPRWNWRQHCGRTGPVCDRHSESIVAGTHDGSPFQACFPPTVGLPCNLINVTGASIHGPDQC